MTLVKISWANLMSKPLNTILSLILLAFGVGIISMLLLLEKQLRTQFDRNIKDIDLVLGAKGSPLQLILANVYHVDAPTGNISLDEANKILKNPFLKVYIDKAIPLAYGDNYQKFRVVGTDKNYPEHYGCVLSEGQLFAAPFEVTIGSKVAQESGLKVGDKFLSTHGLDQESNKDPDHQHTQDFEVKGIFKPSGSAIDNLILTPVESVWMVHEHAHEGEEAHLHEAGADSTEEHIHEAPPREITAYLIKKKNAQLIMMLPKYIKNTNMQVALPSIEINRLNENFGIGMSTLKSVAILIMFISFISVFISLYNSLKDRKYELALMRTMGGSRATLFQLILQEGLLLTLVGFLLGIVLSRIGLFILSGYLQENFHYDVSSVALITPEWILLGVTLLVGIMASLLPALRALKIDISKTLSNE